MDSCIFLNVGVINVSRESFLNNIIIERLKYDFKLMKNMRSEKIVKKFELVSVRSATSFSNSKMLLNIWSTLDFILYNRISKPFMNQFPKELVSQISEVAPNLRSLLFEKSNLTKKFSFTLHGKTIICNFPFCAKDYKESMINLIETLLGAIQEIRSLNLHSPVASNFFSLSLQEPSITDSGLSKYVPPDAAHRHRKSQYNLMSVAEALKLVIKNSSPLNTSYRSFRDCLGYVLAEDVLATEPYPPFRSSVKDGYAVCAGDTSRIRQLIGCVKPGCMPDFHITHGTCVRVSTGSAIPDNADAVIQVEDTLVAEEHGGQEVKIEILKLPTLHQDIRAVGSDVSHGEVLIPAQKKISASDIGILSICGIPRVLLYEKPWVAVLSTGDEVVEPGMPLLQGCIRDSNKSTLIHMLIENRIPYVDVGISKDITHEVKFHLKFALETADIVISTGGVSMGEKDVLKQVLETDFGAVIHFGRVLMKPGKPTTFSTVDTDEGRKYVFSLPGNPVSACVCFYLFVIPCIRKLMGSDHPENEIIKVKLGKDHTLDERPEFCRAYLQCGDDGVFVACITGAQQSSRLLSMQNADALVMLPPRSEELHVIRAGTFVDALVLKNL